MESARYRSARRIARTLLLVSLIALPITGVAANAAPDGRDHELGRLVTEVCAKQTVLLGEDGHHGSGATLDVKVDLVKRLVDECGFNAVYFESSIYDFNDLQRQLDQRSASPEMLADSIGGIWSMTSETDPLIAFLFNKAKAGKVYLAGLDPQFGSATSVYTKSALPIEFGDFLTLPRRQQCVAEIERLSNWTYDDNQQYLDARAGLRECAVDIEKGISRQGKSERSAIAAIMVKNFRRHLDLSSGNSFNKRDKAMYDNFVWHQAHRPDRTKTIVWCATIHAAKNLSFLAPDRRPLGSFIHALQKDSAMAIGFTALGGSYGRNKQAPTSLEPVTPESLESRTFEGARDDVIYLDHKQLAALGTISARALDYAKPMKTDWTDVVDAMLVLRNEHPPHLVRKARPMQKQAIQGQNDSPGL